MSIKGEIIMKILEEQELPKVKYSNGIRYVLATEVTDRGEVVEVYHPDFGDMEPEQENEPDPIPIGRYGRLREKYLQEYKDGKYMEMLLMNTLTDHLRQIDNQAWEMEQQIVKSMAEADGLTEDMKNTDMMYWVGMMNNYKQAASEIIIKELIEI
ncbi:MAG: TnpV protein [Ruminococcus sp.]|nr:TnpV protein [Ruminococcus sp.]